MKLNQEKIIKTAYEVRTWNAKCHKIKAGDIVLGEHGKAMVLTSPEKMMVGGEIVKTVEICYLEGEKRYKVFSRQFIDSCHKIGSAGKEYKNGGEGKTWAWVGGQEFSIEEIKNGIEYDYIRKAGE